MSMSIKTDTKSTLGHAMYCWNRWARILQPIRRLIEGHAKRSHYERTHWVHCAESNHSVNSCIYDPNGNTLTLSELCALINELQDENEELRRQLENERLSAEDWDC